MVALPLVSPQTNPKKGTLKRYCFEGDPEPAVDPDTPVLLKGTAKPRVGTHLFKRQLDQLVLWIPTCKVPLWHSRIDHRTNQRTPEANTCSLQIYGGCPPLCAGFPVQYDNDSTRLPFILDISWLYCKMHRPARPVCIRSANLLTRVRMSNNKWTYTNEKPKGSKVGIWANESAGQV